MRLTCIIFILYLLSFSDSFSQVFPLEKSYLITDKHLYGSGDTLWFSYVLFKDKKFTDFPASKIGYVDLVTESKKILYHHKIHIDSLKGEGNMTLPDSAGRYYLRAYTKYGINGGIGSIEYYDIQVLSDNEVGEKKEDYDRIIVEDYSKKPSLIYNTSTAYADGLIHEIPIRIADDDGNGVFAMGKLLASGKSVSEFRTYEYGLANIKTKLDKRLKYVVRLLVNGVEYDYDLDLSIIHEASMRVLNRVNKILVSVEYNKSVESDSMILVVKSDDGLLYAEKFTPIEKSNFVFENKDLPAGLITFKLLQGDKTLSQFYAFNITPIFSQAASFGLSYEFFNTRDNGKIGVDIPLLLSTIEHNAVSITNQPINDYRVLRNSLAARILFNDELQRLDLRAIYNTDISPVKKLFWIEGLLNIAERVSKRPRSIDFKLEDGFYLKGKTTKYNNKEKPAKTEVFLNVLGSFMFDESQITDENGNFVFGPYLFDDSLEFIIQARKYEKKLGRSKGIKEGNDNYSIFLENEIEFIPEIEIPNFFNYSKMDKNILENIVTQQKLKTQYNKQFLDLISVEMDEITVKDSRIVKKPKEEERQEELTSLYGEPTSRLKVDQSRNIGLNFWDLIRRMPGVLVTGDNLNPQITIRGVGSIQSGTDPFFLLDNVPVSKDYLSGLNAQDIWFIDILVGPDASIYGVNGANGVVSVYSRIGIEDDSSIWLTTGISTYKRYGFNVPCTYKLNPRRLTDIGYPDLRTTLLWKSFGRLNQKDSFNIETSDIPGDYLLVIQGFRGNVPYIVTKKVPIRS